LMSCTRHLRKPHQRITMRAMLTATNGQGEAKGRANPARRSASGGLPGWIQGPQHPASQLSCHSLPPRATGPTANHCKAFQAL